MISVNRYNISFSLSRFAPSPERLPYRIFEEFIYNIVFHVSFCQYD